jgi:RNA polymerase primary sigma factor
MNPQQPAHVIDTINKLTRTSQQMMREIGHEPTPEELAQKMTMPIETVRKLLEIARTPIKLNG